MPRRPSPRVAAAILIAMLSVCAGQQQTEKEPDRSAATPLPIQLETLTERQRAIIRQLHETDESSYLIDTRPVLFQIQGVENDQQQSRGPVKFDRPVDVLIYCLGEMRERQLVDRGWIVDAKSAWTVWEMTADQTVPGGDQPHLRKQVSKIRLPAGSYTLHYHSNGFQAVGDWPHGKPEREFYYGITVFNLVAISKIRDELLNAGLPLDQAPTRSQRRH